MLDTSEENRRRHSLDPHQPVWLFGYGSLIYKADFPFINRQPAFITGWARRFWQGSHDHRGTPEQPGRVVTLIECAGHRCDGMAYQIPRMFSSTSITGKRMATCASAKL